LKTAIFDQTAMR